MSDASKIRLKVGAIEVEYEGSEAFIKDELPKLLDAVAQLYKESGGSMSAPQTPPFGGAGPALSGTTGTIAAKLQSGSGPDLVVAAAARLTFGLAKPSFSRLELLTEMKAATAYYKTSFSANLSKYLASLIKDGKLVESATGVYALGASTATELRAKLTA